MISRVGVTNIPSFQGKTTIAPEVARKSDNQEPIKMLIYNVRRIYPEDFFPNAVIEEPGGGVIFDLKQEKGDSHGKQTVEGTLLWTLDGFGIPYEYKAYPKRVIEPKKPATAAASA